MNIGLLGGTGYVGSVIAAEAKRRGLTVEVLRRCDRNYYVVETLVEWLREVKIEFLICSAGYTGKPNVDACEVNRLECLRGNAVLPGIVRKACESTGIPFGHVSSGCIYTNSKKTKMGSQNWIPQTFVLEQTTVALLRVVKPLEKNY